MKLKQLKRLVLAGLLATLATLATLNPLPVLAQVTDETGARGAFTPDRRATGALGASNAAVTVNLSGRSAVGGFVATGTLSGTVTPEVTVDGTTWVATSVYNLGAGAAPTRAATVTLNTVFAIELPPGARQARIRVSAYTSGTSNGTLVATAGPGVSRFQPTQPISGTVTTTLGAGTNNIGDVDVLTLPAIPAGTNNIGDVDIVTLPALPAGTNNIGDVDVLTLPALVAGTANIGDVDVLTLPALVAGTANIGDVDVATVPAPLSTTGGGTEAAALRVTIANDSTGVVSVDDNGGALTVDGTVTANAGTGTFTVGDGAGALNTIVDSGTINPEPKTSGGLLISRTISAASTNATSVKGSAGQVYTVTGVNLNASPRYLKLYNKASAPTVGTDTPVMTLPIPGNTAGAGFSLDTGGMGIQFTTGIALAITTGVADADTGAVAANEIILHVLYK